MAVSSYERVLKIRRNHLTNVLAVVGAARFAAYALMWFGAATFNSAASLQLILGKRRLSWVRALGLFGSAATAASADSNAAAKFPRRLYSRLSVVRVGRRAGNTV